MTTASFQLIPKKDILQQIAEKGEFVLQPPFFLLLKTGELSIESEEEYRIKPRSLSVSAKEKKFRITGLDENCVCRLLQYDRSYVRKMTFQLNLLDVFKYVYTNSKLTYGLSQKDFENLWLLTGIIDRHVNHESSSAFQKHILRHLNYSFFYSAIENIDSKTSLEPKPTNQKEKLVLKFFENLQQSQDLKLNVSDYAAKQHITTRHLSSTVKELTGMPALELIHRLVLNRAKEAVSSTDKPISEIATALGYTDPYTFSHFFKKQCGMSPTAFRENYQE